MTKVYLVWMTRSEQYYECSLPDSWAERLMAVFETESKAINYIIDCMCADRNMVESIETHKELYRTFDYTPELMREKERYRSWDRIRSKPLDCDVTVHYYYESHNVR